MKKQVSRQSAIGLILVILVTAATRVYAGGVLPEAGIPQSCGVQLKTHNFSMEGLNRAHMLGFCIMRRGFYWASVESEKGVYDFSDYDSQMNHAKAMGLTVVGCLFGNNDLYEDDGLGGIQTEAGRRGFATFAAALAARYKDQNVLWEIWNEPNVRTFWRKNGQHNSDEFAQEYTSLVKEVLPAMLDADPDCFVMAGSVSNYWEPSYEWTESCFKKGVLETGIRGWSVHPYGVKTPEEFAVGHRRMRKLLEQYGEAELPLLNTERGFAVKETYEGWSGGSKQRAREFQAWHFVRQTMIDLLCDVRVSVWYELEGKEFGIVDPGGASPVMTACQEMFRQLTGYRLERRIDSDSKLDYVLHFANETGRRKLVAWTAPPPGSTPDEAISCHVALQTKETANDAEMSNTQQAADALQLTLSGAPQYIEIAADAKFDRCVRLEPVEMVQDTPASNSIERPPGAVDLKLYDEGAPWEFMENTGQGAFTLGRSEDDKRIGILAYDFTESTSRSTPYVLATTSVNIATGAVALWIHARSSIAQQLTFRLIDSTEQTHQYKVRIAGTEQWEAIRIPLTRKLEHWGGAKDGQVHFPIKSLVFSVPIPGEDHKVGTVEYADVVVARDK